jgi:hypothetical protein
VSFVKYLNYKFKADIYICIIRWLIRNSKDSSDKMFEGRVLLNCVFSNEELGSYIVLKCLSVKKKLAFLMKRQK